MLKKIYKKYLKKFKPYKYALKSGVNFRGKVKIFGKVTWGTEPWIITIGNNVVIGSGSVVTKDIPSGVVAAGNPCRVIRPITDKDHAYWKAQEAQYKKNKSL